jgi:hypothetical protein
MGTVIARKMRHESAFCGPKDRRRGSGPGGQSKQDQRPNHRRSPAAASLAPRYLSHRQCFPRGIEMLLRDRCDQVISTSCAR